MGVTWRHPEGPMLAAVLAAAVSNAAMALPVVEGYDLVLTNRLNRTVFEYHYRVRVQSDHVNYADAKVAVSLKPGPTTTTIQQGEIPIGNLPAGAFVRPNDVFVVRHDRATAFDPARLVFDVTAVPIYGGGNGSIVSIGKINLQVNGGRPGHGGAMPLSGDPPAGATIGVSVNVTDSPTSVRYRVLDASGTLLAQESMRQSRPNSSDYVKVLAVPSVPFTIQIVATAPSGLESMQSTLLMRPAPYSFDVLAAGSLLRGGQSPLSFVLRSNSAAGRFVVTATTPPGISVTPASWTVQMQPGSEVVVNGRLSADLNAPQLARRKVIISVAPEGVPAQAASFQVSTIVY